MQPLNDLIDQKQSISPMQSQSIIEVPERFVAYQI